MKRNIKIIIATIVAISLTALSFSIMASAADANVNISVDGDLINQVYSIFYMLKGPAQVGLNYLIAFGQYLAGWIAQI